MGGRPKDEKKEVEETKQLCLEDMQDIKHDRLLFAPGSKNRRGLLKQR